MCMSHMHNQMEDSMAKKVPAAKTPKGSKKPAKGTPAPKKGCK